MMSSSLGNFGRTAQRESSRRRKRCCIGILVFLLMVLVLSFCDSPNLSITVGTAGISSAQNPPMTTTNAMQTQEDIPWNQLFIPSEELGRMDYFSDSWFINRERFLQINVEPIEMVEEACFQVIDSGGTNNKMFVDWTNFSVEHLSKWWKNLQALSHDNSGMADQLVHTLRTFVQKVRDHVKRSSQSPFPKQSAIAMIAFQSYESATTVGPERGYQLTAHSLAATIASLYQVGFHRIVVGGYQHDDSHRVREAFQILQGIFYGSVANSNKQSDNADLEPSLQLGETQVAYVRLEHSWVQTKRVTANIPRGLLLGMQRALRNEFSLKEQAKWIGSSSSQSWQYFYLTEPDTILNTKPEILPLLKNGLDRGWVFFPHRWQPIPHEADLPLNHHSFVSPSRYIPQNVAPFSNITTIADPWKIELATTTVNDDTQKVSYCCDGGMDKPGRSEAFGTKMKPCGKWWWACGYSSSNPPGKPLTPAQVLDLHKRLVPYSMMRLDGGTSVIVAASEMGRRCLPSRVTCQVAPSPQ